MAIEIVDFPMKNGDFPWQNVSSPEGTIHDWIGLRENFNRKPELFSHEINGAFL